MNSVRCPGVAAHCWGKRAVLDFLTRFPCEVLLYFGSFIFSFRAIISSLDQFLLQNFCTRSFLYDQATSTSLLGSFVVRISSANSQFLKSRVVDPVNLIFQVFSLFLR